MLESEWLCCADPGPMLDHLRAAGGTSRRKLRLFAAACCRRIWSLLADERVCQAVAVAEACADGLADDMERRGAREATLAARCGSSGAERYAAEAADYAAGVGTTRAADAVCHAAASAAFHRLHPQYWSSPQTGEYAADWARERAAQARLLRDVVGPLPFRRVAVRPPVFRYNEGLVVRLAQAAYHPESPEGRLNPARLAVLADALEEAGCEEEGVLSHLREEGAVHVRGCWVLDLLLDKG
jgi:hypothetical protein